MVRYLPHRRRPKDGRRKNGKCQSNWKEMDKQFVWHPFTQHAEWNAADPLIIERAKGNYLYDEDGNKYLDAVSSLWCNVHGHNVSEINRAIKDQLGQLDHSTFLGLTHKPGIQLAKELVQLAPPGLSKVFYSDSGATAAEIALKMAYQYWQQMGPTRKVPEPKRKTRFLTLTEAYHGDTIGSVSLGGIDLFHATYKPLLFDTIKAPSPYCHRCPVGYKGMGFDKFANALHRSSKSFNAERDLPCRFECYKVLEKTLREHHTELAAVFMEPLVQGAAGIVVHPPGYLKRIRKLCDDHGLLLILDEVATGFGRTGKMFAAEHEGVSPDIMCIAKGITGGVLPLAATLTTDAVYVAFIGAYEEQKTFYHGHTYTGNPLGCAAALASLHVFRKKQVLQSLPNKIRALHTSLITLHSSRFVGEIRQRGLMVGIELVKDKATRDLFDVKDRVGYRVCMKARDFGVILRPLGDVIVLMPPLSITPSEIRKLARSVDRSVLEVLG
ncbi:MAG: adenosylmethionine--8-amino-7-oxononanoate transaminase [Nitrospirae bacterium]|nr:adenosylmethionine--8-amino-7-oxononanoate transaminase [Nitrospirota bacterium]